MPEKSESAEPGSAGLGGDEKAAAEDNSVVENAPRGERLATYWAPITSSLMAFWVMMIYPCMCGYLDRGALPLSATAAAVAWYGWAVTKVKLPGRLWHIVGVLLASLLLTKNIGDVLWFGHNPVW
jgi:hypothetical protein